MRERLLAELHSQLARFAAEQDQDAILSDEVYAQATQLLLAVPNPAADLEVLHAVGWLHWHRYLALDRGAGQLDLVAALQMLAPVYVQRREAVPEPVRQYFHDNPPTDAMSDHAERLIVESLRTGDRSMLDAAVDLLRQALAAAPADHPKRARYLYNLNGALQTRFGGSDDLADLDEAIDVGEQALATISHDHPYRIHFLSSLGLALRDRFARTDHTGDLDAAVALHEQAVEAMPDDYPDRAGILSRFGNTLRMRYERYGDVADLDRAVEVGQQAVNAVPPDHAERPGYLSSLGGSLLRRFERTGRLADLDRAVEVAQQAVNAAPPEQGRPGYLAGLGSALRARFEHNGDVADLDRAAEVGQQAVNAAPPDHPGRPGYLANLGSTLRVRFNRYGDLADVDRAVEVGQQAVNAAPPDHPDQATYLSELGGALRARFEHNGDLADLDRAVEVGQQAVNAAPPDHPERPGYLSNLGGALQRRFERTGRLADLNRAVEATDQAVATTPPDHPDQALFLSNLSSTLERRFERTGRLADLDRAVEAGDQAVNAAPAGHPNQVRGLAMVGFCLLIRFDRIGEFPDIDRAVDLYRQAVAATPAGQPDRARYLGGLGVALHSRAERTGALADLDEAVEVAQQALAATPADQPDRARSLSALGVTLYSRFKRTGAREDLTAAIAACRGAAQLETAPPSLRAKAAQLWGAWAATRGDWAQAMQGYGSAVNMLGLVAPRSLARSDQEYQLRELAGLGSEAAACCLRAGQVERAVELWEQGRAVLFSQILGIRRDLASLAERQPHLAERFIRIRDELDNVPATAWPPGFAPASNVILAEVDPTTLARAGIDRRRELAEQLKEVLADIRAIPGFERFLLAPPVSDLLLAAEGGPVVLVNVSDLRSDALVLTPGAVETVPLPNLSPAGVRDQVVAFLTALDDVQDSVADAQVLDRAERRLSDILGWLWETITGPVLDHLGITGKPPAGQRWPRVWWCASGLLAFLPLHAAGHHDTRFSPAPTTVLDRVVSSYTPTIRALTYARRPHRGGDRTAGVPAEAGAGPTGPEVAGRVVVVAMPHTPAAGDLPGATAEAELLQQLFPGQVLVLDGGRQATYESVTTALPRYRWAHFACHGSSDLANPSTSHLLLHDHQSQPLTVLDVNRLWLGNAELAFLSACSTARSGARLADEAIHLAAAFQLAGYRHVVATLWPIGDRSAVRAANDIYRTLIRDGVAGAADALHTATRRLRAILCTQPSTWAAHIHNGA